MSDLVSVTLTGPAKIDGERKTAGATVSVPIKLALELAASGVINPDAAKSLSVALQDIPLASDFDAAVAASVAERDGYWSTAFDHFETMAEDREIALERRLEKAGQDLVDRHCRIPPICNKSLMPLRQGGSCRSGAQSRVVEQAEADDKAKPAAKTTKATK